MYLPEAVASCLSASCPVSEVRLSKEPRNGFARTESLGCVDELKLEYAVSVDDQSSEAGNVLAHFEIQLIEGGASASGFGIESVLSQLP